MESDERINSVHMVDINGHSVPITNERMLDYGCLHCRLSVFLGDVKGDDVQEKVAEYMNALLVDHSCIDRSGPVDDRGLPKAL